MVVGAYSAGGADVLRKRGPYERVRLELAPGEPERFVACQWCSVVEFGSQAAAVSHKTDTFDGDVSARSEHRLSLSDRKGNGNSVRRDYAKHPFLDGKPLVDSADRKDGAVVVPAAQRIQ